MKKKSVVWIQFALSLIAMNCFMMVITSCSHDSAYGESSMANPNVEYTGTFKKSDDRDSTVATGSVDATFNTTTRDINYNIKWSARTTMPVGMHSHDDGPVIIQITGFPVNLTDSYIGKANFTANQANDLVSGKIYVMIHTAKYPDGEIMATLLTK